MAVSIGNNTGQADDDADGRVDEDWLDGRDNDRDGLVDEDFAAISHQMFVSEYNDFDPEILNARPDHRPLNIRVHQLSLCWEDPDLDDGNILHESLPDFLLLTNGSVKSATSSETGTSGVVVRATRPDRDDSSEPGHDMPVSISVALP